VPRATRHRLARRDPPADLSFASRTRVQSIRRGDATQRQHSRECDIPFLAALLLFAVFQVQPGIESAKKLASAVVLYALGK